MNQSDQSQLDGRLVRRFLGLPDSANDKTVNRAMGELAKDRNGWRPRGEYADTLDEALFRSMIGADATTPVQVLNEKMRDVIGKEADADALTPLSVGAGDDVIRRRLGIDKATRDRHNRPGTPACLTAIKSFWE